jgi:hypothetical protein
VKVQESSRLEALVTRYQGSPLLRGLIQLLVHWEPTGVAGALEAGLVTKIQNVREERLKTFFDELEAGKIQLTRELIESEDFLHCYFATVRAALNSRRREKIQMFARLLKSSAMPLSFSGTDEYEEYLSILDDLSYREILVLATLERYTGQFPLGPEENELQRANRFWDDFTKELEHNLGLPAGEIDGVLTRLNRTGCYETFTGAYLDYSGGRGRLTATYFRLRKLVEAEDGRFP